MGYFSNGCEGGDYEERYCNQCVHQYGIDGETPCAVWTSHLMCNYEESNNPSSILHMLIPLSKDGMSNEECEMFLAKHKPLHRCEFCGEIPLTESEKKHIGELENKVAEMNDYYLPAWK